jgi:L-fuconolactonase
VSDDAVTGNPDPGPAHPRVARIDAHHHVWDLAVRDQPWTAGIAPLRRTFPFDELRPQLNRAGIDATVLVQTIAVPEETPEFLVLAAAYPEVRGVVGWVDLTADDVSARLDALRSGPGGEHLVGIRHPVQGEADPRWLLRPDVGRGLQAVAGAGLVYDLLVTEGQLPAAIDAVRRHPDLRFVLDHAGKPLIAAGELEPWRANIRTLAQLPNVTVKLSGLLTEATPSWTVDDIRQYTDHVVDSFGPTRMMFGSDWPVSTLRAAYRDVVAVSEGLVEQCSVDERGAVFGTTALTWYELDRTGR